MCFVILFYIQTCHFQTFTQMKSYNIWSFVSGFFHLAQVFEVRLCCRMCMQFIPLHSQIVFYNIDIKVQKRTSLVAQMVKPLSTMWETGVRSLGREDPLEKEMATHSSTLAWKIPWTEKPDRIQSIGSQRVRHD